MLTEARMIVKIMDWSFDICCDTSKTAKMSKKYWKRQAPKHLHFKHAEKLKISKRIKNFFIGLKVIVSKINIVGSICFPKDTIERKIH